MDKRPAPTVNAGPDKTIVEGDQVTLQGIAIGTPATIAWAPNGGLSLVPIL